jgi:hypothetical protein
VLEGIRTVEVEDDDDGNMRFVRLVFGPHYYVVLERRDDGKVNFILGATHHGFKADASEVGGELEELIQEIRRGHPQLVVD